MAATVRAGIVIAHALFDCMLIGAAIMVGFLISYWADDRTYDFIGEVIWLFASVAIAYTLACSLKYAWLCRDAALRAQITKMKPQAFSRFVSQNVTFI